MLLFSSTVFDMCPNRRSGEQFFPPWPRRLVGPKLLTGLLLPTHARRAHHHAIATIHLRVKRALHIAFVLRMVLHVLPTQELNRLVEWKLGQFRVEGYRIGTMCTPQTGPKSCM